LKDIKSISTSSINLQTGEWGVAVLKAQTNSPDTTNVSAATFILYRDTFVTDLLRTSPEPPPPVNCAATTTRPTNLRGSPMSNGPSLQLLQPTTRVNVTERSADAQWVHVEFQDTVGWLNAQTVRLSCTLSAL